MRSLATDHVIEPVQTRTHQSLTLCCALASLLFSASTSEAAFQNPSDQWGSYLARCGRWSPGGRGKGRPSPERQRLAHQTHGRIFSEQAAAVEDAVTASVGGGLDVALDYTATVAAADAAANAVASAALRASPSKRARAPIVDSHGMWVGEAIEQQLKGAAGATSADLWQKKEDNKYENRRLDFLAKAASAKMLPATGAGPVSESAPDLDAKAATGAAGLTSKSLYRSQREKQGVLDEHSAPGGGRGGASPAGSRRPSYGGEAAPFAWPSGTDVVADYTDNAAVSSSKDAATGKRAVAGLTSSELYEMSHKNKPRAAAVSRGGDDGTKCAGVDSAGLAQQTTELKLEAEPRAVPHGGRKPDQRLDCEVKTALTDVSSAPMGTFGSDFGHGRGGSDELAIVSNAPAKCFDGAAGMNSAEVRKARQQQQQRRHTSPLLGPHANAATAPPPKPAEAAAASGVAPVPKLPLKAAGVVLSPGDSKEDYAVGPSAAAMALGARPDSARRAADASDAGSEKFAGQFSGLIQKPTSAWEARHMWSEATKPPKGGFGDRVSAAAAGAKAGGAGMSSDQLATYAKELKFEGSHGSNNGPVGRSGSPRPMKAAAAHEAPAAYDGAAGLTSSKICEIGPGMVNKYDLPSPGAGGANGGGKVSADAGDTSGQKQAHRQEMLSGAAGMTSKHLATNALAEQSAEQRRLSLLASHVAQSRALSPAARRPPPLESVAAFSGAAGVSSTAMGVAAGKREFVSDDVPEPAARGASPRAASPRLMGRTASNASSGVAGIFGGRSEVAAAAAEQATNALERSAALGHGMSSRAVAIQRLVSRACADQPGGGKGRSASEPRRRPSTGGGGGDAASLLYGNAFGGGEPSAFGVSSNGGAPADMGVAGRSSNELHLPREERRMSRSGNMADGLWSSGGLGGYMSGGLDNARRRDSSGGNSNSTMMVSVAHSGGVAESKPMGWSPSRRPMRQCSPRAMGGGENSVSAALGMGSPAARMVTSSSAIGAGWGSHQGAAAAQAASPVRGLRA